MRTGAVSYRFYRTTPDPAFASDIDRAFGVWHPPGASIRHVLPCWDVTYHANAYGARDIERSRRSTAPRRHIVLGDSFVEGLGVADGQRFSDRLEAATGEEFLNFGTGGGFGTVQEMVQYGSLASSFDHSDVLLFVLPLNDFVDNDPRLNNPGRYRPYLRRKGDSYEVYYTVRFEDRDLGQLSPALVAANWLSNKVYVLDFLRQIYERRKIRSVSREIPYQWLSYRSSTPADVDVMAAAIREIGVSAGARPVHVFVIPVQIDLDHYQPGAPYPFPAQLRAAVASATNVDVTDLLPDYLAYAEAHHLQSNAFYASCDPHWSPLGNAVAAEAVARHLSP